MDAAIAGQSVDLSDYYTLEPRAIPGTSQTTRTRATPKSSPWSATAFPSRGKSGASCPGRRWPGATSSPRRLLQGGGGRQVPQQHRLHDRPGRALPGHKRQRRLQRGLHRHQRRQRRAQAAEGHLATCPTGLEPHSKRHRYRAHLRRLDQGGGRRSLLHPIPGGQHLRAVQHRDGPAEPEPASDRPRNAALPAAACPTPW